MENQEQEKQVFSIGEIVDVELKGKIISMALSDCKKRIIYTVENIKTGHLAFIEIDDVKESLVKNAMVDIENTDFDKEQEFVDKVCSDRIIK